MTIIEIENKLMAQSYIEPEMIESAFAFWFSNNEHIRSPFPEYIKDELRILATDNFLSWTSQISEKAKKDVNDEILAEKLEEIIFEKAHDMVTTEDEKLTVKYPFMLRVGDFINAKDADPMKDNSKVIEREIIKRGDEVLMKVKLQNVELGNTWETEFELPE